MSLHLLAVTPMWYTLLRDNCCRSRVSKVLGALEEETAVASQKTRVAAVPEGWLDTVSAVHFSPPQCARHAAERAA
jgi:hypothetical protein